MNTQKNKKAELSTQIIVISIIIIITLLVIIGWIAKSDSMFGGFLDLFR